MTYLLTLNNDPNPATLRYMEEHAKPFMEANWLEFHTVQRRRKDGTYNWMRHERAQEAAAVAVGGGR